MPLFLLLCTGIRGKLLLRFSGFFFWIEGWVGGVYRIQTFLDFYIFFKFTRPLTPYVYYVREYAVFDGVEYDII